MYGGRGGRGKICIAFVYYYLLLYIQCSCFDILVSPGSQQEKEEKMSKLFGVSYFIISNIDQTQVSDKSTDGKIKIK